MPQEVLTDALVLVNAVDLSDHVETVVVTYGEELKVATVMGDTGVRRLAGKISDWSMQITFRQDYDAAKVDATLFPLVGAAQFAMKARKSKTDAISATNPEWQGNGMIDGDLPVLNAELGEVHNLQVTIVGADGVALNRATA